ncbi:hypothetical protein CASFOL_024935 [Castilleja foliolosa]|uniref:Oxidative stress 3 n=1 Tax=Castilleja foliolosa TaxID=1961234 RepID=A0ABD3CRL3_9LAMI
MAEGKNQQLFQDSWFQFADQMKKNTRKCSSSTTSSIGEESTVSNGSSITSSDTADDASSSNSSSALYDLSEIMTQLPIKRGLSKFYQGKSESFTALSRVTSVEDLAKPCRRRNMKGSKSIATGLHSYKSYTLPKAIIAKRKQHKGFLFSK